MTVLHRAMVGDGVLVDEEPISGRGRAFDVWMSAEGLWAGLVHKEGILGG